MAPEQDMRGTLQKHNAGFKAKLVLAAINGKRTILACCRRNLQGQSAAREFCANAIAPTFLASFSTASRRV
jgi:hypothetical protein